ncbi:MAG: hypothetical protein HS115_07505 [Spirochaetales bacterium]|nr:hypothetical protein [Spirochaetales bacterium]
MMQGLNPALSEMVARGQLDAPKIHGLIRLKNFIDGYAKSNFVSTEQENEQQQKFGTTTDIKTWGDYFQTEIASRFFDAPAADFERILETVRYDVIAALLVFSGKPESFLKEAVQKGHLAIALTEDQWSAEDREDAHLGILAQYFVDMKLDGVALKTQDREWFDRFARAAEVV